MAMIRRITEINGEIIVVETMIIVGEIVLITVQINGELVRYEILSVRAHLRRKILTELLVGTH